MDDTWREAIWQQFGAAIQVMENAIRACPDELWRGPVGRDESMPPEFAEFWYVAFHALFWLDLYLTGTVEGFAPPEPFGLEELDPAGLLSDRPYTRSELLAYVDHGREKCRATIRDLTDEQAGRRLRFPWGELTFAELLLYSMRHIMEHAAQMNLVLGQASGAGPGWVGRAKRPLDGGAPGR